MEEVIRLHDRTGELFILTHKTVVKMGVTLHDREAPIMAKAVFIEQGLHAGRIGKVMGFRGEHEAIVKVEQFHGLVEIRDGGNAICDPDVFHPWVDHLVTFLGIFYIEFSMYVDAV